MSTSLLTAKLLIGVGLATPALALLACFSRPMRARLWWVLALIPLPALAAAMVVILVLSSGEVDAVSLLFDPSGLAIGVAVDRPGAVLLGGAALLWAAAGLYAGPMLQASLQRGRFTLFWLLTLTGSLGVFVAADLVSFYLTYGLVSLAAFGLIAHAGGAFARRATGVYLLFAILGEIALLLAFALLSAASPTASLSISNAVAALDGSPWYGITMALLLIGFALKIALVPVHVWMPLAYTAAPFPAAAVLSGAAVKAGVIGLIRFMPFEAGAPGWAELLLTIGFMSAFYGVAVGITQRNAKTVLAYSSISQMGYLAAAAGLGLRAGESVAALLLTLYAAHHLLAKGALFLGLGVIADSVTRRRSLVMVPAALVALGIAGLPLTGGAVAKLALKPLFDGPLLGLLAALAAAGSTLLMLHFLRCLWASAEPASASGAGLVRRLLSWWLMALAALLVPWALLMALGLDVRPIWVATALSPVDIWKALWPLLVGSAAALALGRWGARLPALPPGDILALGAPAARLAAAIGATVEWLDGALRRWPVAGLAVLMIALLLFGAAIDGH